MKKTLNENNDFQKNWKTIIIIATSALVGGVLLIISLLKNIENSQQIKIDPLPNANQLEKKRIEVKSNNESYIYDVYIADDSQSRATGLMNIKYLPENEGMLFIFPDSENLSFWMKDTYIPLAIIFFDRNKKLINYYENAEPLNESERYPSLKPAKYVLELNAKSAKEMNLTNETSFIFLD